MTGKLQRIPVSVLCLLLLLVAACDSSVAPEERVDDPVEHVPDEPAPDPSWPALAAIDRTLASSVGGYGDLHAEPYAQVDYIVLNLRAMLSDAGAENVAKIRAANPDVVIIGALSVLCWRDHWNDDYQRDILTLGSSLWDVVSDRPARTTTGEAALMWDRAPMLNPLRDGRLDEAMLDEFVDAIVAHFERYPGVADGIMHDYTSASPWIYPSPQEAGIGEIDLDQDGVPFADDPAEQDAWFDWQYELVGRLQERLGSGLIQIANGRLPIDRPDFARQLAGVWFQNFPTLPWNFAPRDGIETLLDLRENHLTPRRGRTWCLLAPETFASAGDVPMRRITSFLTGTHYAVRHSLDDVAVGDPDAEDYGVPTGELVRERMEDGGTRYSRAYTAGVVELEFYGNGVVRAVRLPSP